MSLLFEVVYMYCAKLRISYYAFVILVSTYS